MDDDSARRSERFARYWKLPHDAATMALVGRRIEPTGLRRAVAPALVLVPALGLYVVASFSEPAPLRLAGVVTLTCALAGVTLARTLAAARRDAATSRTLARHVTRSAPLRVEDVYGRTALRVSASVHGIALVGSAVEAVISPSIRGVCLALVAAQVVLAGVWALVLRTVATRPTVADTSSGLLVDLALRRQRASVGQLLTLYAATMPLFTLQQAGWPGHAVAVRVASLLGILGALVSMLLQTDRRDGLLDSERRAMYLPVEGPRVPTP